MGSFETVLMMAQALGWQRKITACDTTPTGHILTPYSLPTPPPPWFWLWSQPYGTGRMTLVPKLLL